ncbi:MAG: N-acetylmuramoyl-L-alanine amidase [Acidobacteria bacterium]|nr:N-acetylmuramoyl-L-alanine amidase [Acidobacteriota bacterium]
MRVAETKPGVTRVVIDVSREVEVVPSQLTSPDRLVIELRAAPPAAAGPPVTAAPLPTAPPALAAPSDSAARPDVGLKAEAPKPEAPKSADSPKKDSTRQETAKAEAPKPEVPRAAPGGAASGNKAAGAADSSKKDSSRQETAKAEAPKPETPRPGPGDAVSGNRATGAQDSSKKESSRQEAAKAEAPKPQTPRPAPGGDTGALEATAREVPRPPLAPTSEDESAKAARHTSSGGNSLTRALGLKLNRIVLDAGHGGHDQGTSGPRGLLEKDLVLDVTLRLGKLIEDGLGAEVIYTRKDDTFIPLETRTAIANEKKADLFLSIHANSSPVARITGVETYYLNFTDSKDSMDLAARENAASHRSIFELQDLLQKITLHEKLDESREFAGRVQAALYAFNSRSFPGQKNRGVKKAPFVVLIGAQMPSILAEIGFVTNPREEQLLKRPDYRQHLAEALYKGVARYADSLSHFQLAQNQ